MRITFLISLFLTFSSCSKPKAHTELSDDYALVEFAASLEEDYQKIYPEKSSTKVQTEEKK